MTATIHKVAAGNGYQYYLRNVAANDVSARGRSSLADYYSAHGEAPGRWHGTGLAALGIQPGEEVTEEQLKSLLGLGRHPNADVIEARVYDEQMYLGAKHKDAARAADRASRLGDPFRVYAEVSEFRKRCAKAFAKHNSVHGFDPHDAISDDERALIRTRVAFEMFCETYDRAPLDARELSGWVARNSRPNTVAVAGFDITFSPVKSVSVLWALAPRTVAGKIELAHQRAVRDALVWLERNAVFTRLGRNGVRQVDVEGIVAACFTHRDSRAGDPDLHTHVVIANRVRTLDGKWRTLDGAAIYQAVVTVSEIYNTRLEHHMQDLVGVEFAERPTPDPSKRPIREIVGIPQRLITTFSRRDTTITTRLGQLTAEFQQARGREPTPGEIYDLAERATLETRPIKHALRSLAEQRHAWRAEAVALLGGRDAVARMVTAALNPIRTARPAITADWITRTAEHVIEVVSEHRSTWQRHNLRAEIERQLRGHVNGPEWEQVAEAVLTETISPTLTVARGDPDLADEPELRTVPVLLARRDGTSVYTSSGAQIYTSARTLSVERQLIEMSLQPGARQLRPDLVTAAVDRYNTRNPERPLNAGQISVVEGFASSNLRVRTTNAPAGTGKTTAMAVLTDAWHTSGGRVLGLAPTASAAAELGKAIGARVETVDKVLDILDRHTPSPDNLALDREQPPSLPQWILDIDPDTLVIVDEHVKIGNLKRLRLLRFLHDRGATIRCIGDPHQLASIEAGGADTDMDAAAPEATMTLTHVVRFASNAEATASLQLREGDPAALGWYLDNGRIHAGHEGATHDDAYTAWITDHLAGPRHHHARRHPRHRHRTQCPRSRRPHHPRRRCSERGMRSRRRPPGLGWGHDSLPPQQPATASRRQRLGPQRLRLDRHRCALGWKSDRETSAVGQRTRSQCAASRRLCGHPCASRVRDNDRFRARNHRRLVSCRAHRRRIPATALRRTHPRNPRQPRLRTDRVGRFGRLVLVRTRRLSAHRRGTNGAHFRARRRTKVRAHHAARRPGSAPANRTRTRHLPRHPRCRRRKRPRRRRTRTPRHRRGSDSREPHRQPRLPGAAAAPGDDRAVRA
ncbi:MobF family relaxase [Nocardia pseudovaccinii]|uniref:MobF family relaxase n=1 Tax=Nocardia pseudovaccinii TaxID=189540 RepID=UPI000A88DCE6|nr:MobF family relaxase [Nocardia pseudovaccinii]